MLLCPVWAKLRSQLLQVACCCFAYAVNLQRYGIFSLSLVLSLLHSCQ